MGLLDGFEKLINEHGSAVILKERIALANDKYAILEKEASVLKSENERLKLDNEECQKQRWALEEKLSHISIPQEYFEESGALFKRRPNGEWDFTPYCPACKTAMVSPSRLELYVCGKKSCGQRASFNRLHVDDAINRLPNVQQLITFEARKP